MVIGCGILNDFRPFCQNWNIFDGKHKKQSVLVGILEKWGMLSFEIHVTLMLEHEE